MSLSKKSPVVDVRLAPSWIDDVVASLPAVCTTDEAVSVLRCSRRCLYRWIAAGKIPAVKTGAGNSARVLIPRVAIADFLRQMEAA